MTDDPESVELAEGAVSEMDGAVVSGVKTDAAGDPPIKIICPGAKPGKGAENGDVVVAIVGAEAATIGGICDDVDVETPELMDARVSGPKYPVGGSPWAD